jgi:NAD(P)-dependent dehydrogenase (short-subunit alcohol dehydrogenase family)
VTPRYLVTGASRGIGRAIALRLARTAAVVATVRTDEDARALAHESNGRIASLRVDLSDRAARARVISDAERSFGGLDGLVHAAGLGEHRRLEAIDHAQIDRHFELNVFAALDLAQALARSLRARRAPGSMLFLTSTLADRPAPTTTVYAATKGALTSLTRTLALELAPDRIRVNALAPGVIDTDMVRSPRLAPGEAMPEGEARAAREAAQLTELARLHPLGRVGRPDEVAEAADYLLHAQFATGTVLVLDGGLSLV